MFKPHSLYFQDEDNFFYQETGAERGNVFFIKFPIISQTLEAASWKLCLCLLLPQEAARRCPKDREKSVATSLSWTGRDVTLQQEMTRWE